MTKDPARTQAGDAPRNGPGATAEWFPAAGERLLVSRTVSGSASDLERALRVQPESLVRLAYHAELVETTPLTIFLSPVKSQRWLRVPARIEFWTPPPHHSGAIISLKWQANRLSSYFPVLEADLSVRPAPSGAQLELDGSYRPPLGIVGLIFDYVVGRRIATAAAVGFVDALALAIEQNELPGISF